MVSYDVMMFRLQGPLFPKSTLLLCCVVMVLFAVTLLRRLIAFITPNYRYKGAKPCTIVTS